MTKTRRLPVRYWRWMWLGEALRLLSILFLAVMIPVYYAALGVTRGIDWLDRKLHILRMAFYISDKRRAGWEPSPPPRLPAPALSDEWTGRRER